tara:strand:- start:356 stop:808 length:453 start_codon:yes stop_codon:yes gene_type:complete
MTTASRNSYVTVHYRGTLDDGTEFDNSRRRGQPLSFVVGSNQMIPQFEEEMIGTTEGESKTFTIEEAYGQYQEDALTRIEQSAFPEDFEFDEEIPIPLQGPNGPMMGKFIRLTEDEQVEIDLNHPLAGEDLTFHVEVLSVIDTEEPESDD